MEYSYFSLGMIGVWELVVILGTMVLMAAAVVSLVFLAIWFSKRNGTPSAPPGHRTSTAKLPTCPRCGIPLSADAPQGLCPRCVMQVGIGTEDGAEPAFQDSAGKPNPPNPAELAKHFPQLEIIELLGQGGMGAVYKARQKDLDRLVALKVLPGGAGGDPAFAERFTREARALARLSHPNIVAVHEFGQVRRSAAAPAASANAGEGAGAPVAGEAPALLYYFIMEFIDGPNLRQLLHGQKLSPREAMSIVPKICEALQFAHDEGIVHRDIKPENILVDRKGRVKIADFGIAKIVGQTRDATITGAKDVIGTPHYMAPEQVEKPQQVDHRADIYSLGVVFYEMLTGELPLGKFELPSRKVQVDVRLDEVVLRTLEKEPQRRYQHASEVKTDVETIASGAVKSDVRTQNAEEEPGPDKSKRGNWQPVLAAMLLVSCVILWALMGYLTFIQPIMLERFQEAEAELPSFTHFILQVGNVLNHFADFLVPLLVIVTGGAVVWLFLSAIRPKRPAYHTDAQTRSTAPVAGGEPMDHPRRFTLTDSRLSRLAVVGACWAPLFFITTLMFISVRTVSVPEGAAPPGPAWWQIGLSFTLLPLGLAAPFGTTICGVVALSRIRRAGGRLCGLGVALFDALLFPLLALDGLIVWLVYLLMCQSLVWVGFEPGTEVAIETALLPAALIITVVDVWLIRWGWRSAKRMSGRVPTSAEHAAAATWTKLAIPASLLLLLGAAAVMVASPVQSKRRVEALRIRQQAEIDRIRMQSEAEAKRLDPVAAGSAVVPPVVVSAKPESGSSNVSPSLTELRVTFSKPMREGSWAWCKLDDETFPEMTGAPHYLEDARTCVLPVKLLPGRTYATWINVDQFQDFRGQSGQAAVPYLLIFETRENTSATDSTTGADAPELVTVGQGGDARFTSIQEAIDAVAEGGTVRIGSGRYTERLDITKPVRLVGAGWEQTAIGPTGAWEPPSAKQVQEMQRRFETAQSDAVRARLRVEFTRKVQPPVVFIQNAAGVFLEQLKFTQPGVAPDGELLSGSVIEVWGSKLEMKGCAVLGSPGNGVVLTDGTRADVRDTLIAAAWSRGVAIDDDSHAVVEGCDIRNCHYAGVTIGRGADVVVERCRISGAAWHGIRYDHVSPRIEGNLIFGNARSGIYASGRSAAQVRQNVFFNNEMNGISCWSDNKDVIEGNTFAENQREALAILGASAPTVRSNIFSGHPVGLIQWPMSADGESTYASHPQLLHNVFWNNGTNWVRSTHKDTNGVWQAEAVELGAATQSRFEDPQFADAAQDDFKLLSDSLARQDGIGVAEPIPYASPWPLQPEELAIIPDGDTRDYSQWKRPKR